MKHKHEVIEGTIAIVLRHDGTVEIAPVVEGVDGEHEYVEGTTAICLDAEALEWAIEKLTECRDEARRSTPTTSKGGDA